MSAGGDHVQRHGEELTQLVRDTVQRGLEQGLIPASGLVQVSISDCENMIVHVSAELEDMGETSNEQDMAVSINMGIDIQLLSGITGEQ